MDQEVKKLGFFTTRYVRAKDTLAAEWEALHSVQTELERVGIVLNDPSDPPSVVVRETCEVSLLGWYRGTSKGFTWYPQEEGDNPSH